MSHVADGYRRYVYVYLRHLYVLCHYMFQVLSTSTVFSPLYTGLWLQRRVKKRETSVMFSPEKAMEVDESAAATDAAGAPKCQKLTQSS